MKEESPGRGPRLNPTETNPVDPPGLGSLGRPELGIIYANTDGGPVPCRPGTTDVDPRRVRRLKYNMAQPTKTILFVGSQGLQDAASAMVGADTPTVRHTERFWRLQAGLTTVDPDKVVRLGFDLASLHS